MKYKNIYVAASRQHVGKTTSTLGLVAAFTKKGLDVGYCKPVGQKFLAFKDLKVDKDTVLFADLIKFEIDPKIHSPVILGRGATKIFLDTPDKYDFTDTIIEAREELNRRHELTIFEGTGHPGVGSIANLSNAKVAKLLNASVVMIIEGGIGSTIDMLNMCLSLFREENVPILGVIINKVIPDKMDEVEKYVGKWLRRNNLPLLGLIPYDKSLGYPIVGTVTNAINGKIEANQHMIYNKVENILAGSLLDLKELSEKENHLLVVSVRLASEAIKRIEMLCNIFDIEKCPLSGIVITGEEELGDDCLEYIEKNEIPLIRTEFDTYGAVLKISKIEVKITVKTPWKIHRAIELIQENIELDKILNEV